MPSDSVLWFNLEVSSNFLGYGGLVLSSDSGLFGLHKMVVPGMLFKSGTYSVEVGNPVRLLWFDYFKRLSPSPL